MVFVCRADFHSNGGKFIMHVNLIGDGLRPGIIIFVSKDCQMRIKKRLMDRH